MEKKKILFLINPISGTHDKGKIEKIIEEQLNKELFDYQVLYTQHAGHASELTRNAVAENVHIVVAVGGDGTVNEVARSLIHSNTALGIVPCGSGNGLARHLQIPLEPHKAIKLINKDCIERLDYGIINQQPFFCTCGVGFDAFISQKFAESGKRGLITYIENTLKEWLKYKPETYLIEDEEGTYHYKAILIACANASQYGNNAYIAPQASMSDGLMDITVMEPFNAVEAPQIAIQLFNKRIEHNSHIKTFRSRRIKIIRENEGAAHCDGDPIKTGKVIDVELIAKEINMVINPSPKADLPNLFDFFDDSFDLISSLHNEIKKRNLELLKKGQEIFKKLNK